jgi:hypothetical protein
MSNTVTVGKIKLQDHPTNPDLQIGTINGHQVVVGRHYDPDTLGFFIPEGAIVPDKLADEMWVRGRLAGKQRNRVKTRELHGVHSEGLFYGSCYWTKQGNQWIEVSSPSWNNNWKEGDDVAKEVGITFAEELVEA